MTVLQLKRRIIKDIEQVDNEKILAEMVAILEKEIANKSLPSDKTEANKKFKLSDLKGKLEWKGDPMEMQRELRNEWD